MKKEEMSFSTRCRVMLVQMIYSLIINRSDLKNSKEISATVYGASVVSRYKAIHSSEKDNLDVIQLLKILENIQEIDQLIEKSCNNTMLNRLPNVVLSILRVGVYELKYISHQHKIGNIIKDYLNIAVAFDHDAESGFIHGVLDKIYSTN